jgi:hypothetical protein
MPLIEKSRALYFHPDSIGEDQGAHCGICIFYRDNSCKIVEGSIDAEKGICGLYIFAPVSKAEAGYSEQGPTHCRNCDEMLVPKLYGESRCKKVEGMVEGRACCSLWEEVVHVRGEDIT